MLHHHRVVYLHLQEGRQYLSELSNSLGRDSAALLREAAAAIEEVRRESRGQSATAARLAALEDKLAVLEGAVVGAGISNITAVTSNIRNRILGGFLHVLTIVCNAQTWPTSSCFVKDSVLFHGS